MDRKPNRLVDEQSPYLRQHAWNPVDWYPWGNEALERARRENRPILLSIGYSACHWCHVMERESFEDESIARSMNDGFVNIKVDREERPDLDAIYMNVVQMLTGSGGWPLTAFLDPDGKPFYAGTYFPPEDRYGRPGFPRVLAAVLDAYHQKRPELGQTTAKLLEGLGKLSRFQENGSALRRETFAAAAENLLSHHDGENGGLGTAPKFPNVPAFTLLLRAYRETNRSDFLAAFEKTLDGMAHGGVYDQLAGGFHRYSVDEHWLVPHFEKMLYDNAQLVPLYLDGYLATGKPLYREIAADTLDYLRNEMTHPEGGFYATQDADTEGEEGQTYLWRLEEIRELLDDSLAELVVRYYQVDEVGNFAEPGQSERKSILHVKLSLEEMGRLFDKEPQEIRELLEQAKRILLDARNKRPQPGRDEKVLTSWNALAIRAFVQGSLALGVPDYLKAAERAASFLENHLRDESGRLLRTCKDGVAKYEAYLDDYAFYAAAMLDLFEATGKPDYLQSARQLCDTLLADFLDPSTGGFFFTASGHEQLIDRPKIAFDSSIPAGNAVATESLLRLGRLLGDESYSNPARQTLALFGTLLEQQPLGLAYLLGVLDDELRGPTDVVIVGPPDHPDTTNLLAVTREVYAPEQSVFVVDPNGTDAFVPAPVRGKTAAGDRPRAYVCRNFSCSAPVEEPEKLAALLREPGPQQG